MRCVVYHGTGGREVVAAADARRTLAPALACERSLEAGARVDV